MIRLALVGCGGMGGAHAARFSKLSDRLKLVAAVDIDQEKADAAAKNIGADKAVTDFREILPEVDAVLLSLPHHLHHSIGMECLQAGKHVLMEKPLANSERECLELIDEADKQGVILMTAYPLRYHPLVVRMYDLVQEKAYGDIFHVSMWTEQLSQYPSDHWISSAEKLGGGQLFSHGCHYIDLLLWYLGHPIEGTHVGTRFGTPWMEKEGTSDVSIRFENGAVGYHAGTWGARGSRLFYSFHAHGTEGMIEMRMATGQLILHQWGQEEKVLYESGAADKYVEHEMSHFLDCIEKNQRPLTDGPGSLQGLRVIWRLYEAEEKHVVADLRGLGLDQYKKA